MITNGGSRRSTTYSATCAGELPFRVDVPAAIDAPMFGNTDGSHPDGQVVEQWALPGMRIELRWPAPVGRDDLPSAPPLDKVLSIETRVDGATVSVADSGYVMPRELLTLHAVGARLPTPCDRTEIRVYRPDGTYDALTYRFAPADPDLRSARCGGSFPARVDVPDATSGPTVGTAAGQLEDGQVAEHWATPQGTLELRWPPSTRALYGTEESAYHDDFSATSLSADGRTLIVANSTTPAMRRTFTMTVRTDATSWPRPCDRVEVTRYDNDGSIESFVYKYGIDRMFDQGALIRSGPVIERPGTISAGAAIECGDRLGTATPVTGAPIAATPGEALRDYLAAPVGTPLDLPSLPRIYRPYHTTRDDTYYYERYTNWDEHLAITVQRASYGWKVTNWTLHPHC